MLRWSNLLKQFTVLHCKSFTRASKALSVSSFHSKLHSPCSSLNNHPIENFFYKGQHFFSNVTSNVYKDACLRLKVLAQEDTSKYHQVIDKYTSSEGRDQLSPDEVAVMLRVLYEMGKDCQQRSANKESNYDEAFKYFFEGLDLANKKGIKGIWELAFIYGGIGSIHLIREDLKKAEEYLDKASSILENIPDNALNIHMNVHHVCMLSVLYEKQERFDEAVEMLSLTLDKLSRGPALPESMVELYEHLGQRFNSNNEGIKAVSFWRKGLDIAVKYLGEDSSEARAFYRNLLTAYAEQKKFPESLTYVQKLLKVNAKDNVPDHEKISNLILISHMYIEQAKFSYAEDTLDRALKILESQPNRFLESAVEVHKARAGVFLGQNRFVEAVKCFDQTEEAIIKAYGERDPQLGEHYISVATLFTAFPAGKAESLNLFQKAIEFYKRLGHSQKANLVNTYIVLSETLFHQHKYEEALKNLEEALKVSLEEPADTSRLEQLYSYLGTLYSRVKKPEQAVKCFNEAIKACEEIGNLPQKHYYFYYLGKAHEELDQLEQAREVYQKLLDMDTVQFGKEDAKTKISAESLFKILMKLEKHEEARKLQNEYKIIPK